MLVDCLMQVYRIGFLVTSLPVNCNIFLISPRYILQLGVSVCILLNISLCILQLQIVICIFINRMGELLQLHPVVCIFESRMGEILKSQATSQGEYEKGTAPQSLDM